MRLTFKHEIPVFGLAGLLALEGGLAAEVGLSVPAAGPDLLPRVGEGLPTLSWRFGAIAWRFRAALLPPPLVRGAVPGTGQGLLGALQVSFLQGLQACGGSPAELFGQGRVAGQLAKQGSGIFRVGLLRQGPGRLAQSTSRFALLVTTGPRSSGGVLVESDIQAGLQLLGQDRQAFQDVAGVDLGILQGALQRLQAGLEFFPSGDLKRSRRLQVPTQFSSLPSGGGHDLGVRASPGKTVGGKGGQGDGQAGQKQTGAEPGRPALGEGRPGPDLPGPVGRVAQQDLGHDVPGALGDQPLHGRPHALLQSQVAVGQVGRADGAQGTQEFCQGCTGGEQGQGSQALPGGLTRPAQKEDQEQRQEGSGAKSLRRDVQGPDLALSCGELASLLQEPHLVHDREIPRLGGRPCGGGATRAGELVLNMDSRGFHMLDRRRFQWLVPCLLFLLLGCSSPAREPQPPAASDPGVPAAQALEPEAPPASHRLEFRMPADVVRANLKVRQPGQKWQLVDGQDRPLAEFKVQPDRVKVRDAQDRELFKVKSKLKGWELEDATGRRLLRARPNRGGWEIQDGAEAPLARIVERGGGLVLEDAQGRELTRAEAGSGEVLFHNPSGGEAAVLRGASDPAVAIWWMLPETDPLAQAGLVVFALEVR